MNYNALFLSDAHLSNTLPHAKRMSSDPQEEPLTDRLYEIYNAIISFVGRHPLVPDVWFPGDLVDRRVLDAVTLRVVNSLLVTLVQDMGKRVIIVPGNHEAADRQCSAYVVDGLTKLDPKRILVLKSGVFEAGSIKIYPFAYQPEDRLVEQLRSVPKDSHVVIHQTVKGALMGVWRAPVGVAPEELAPFFTLSGHVHNPQPLPSPARGHYLGSPYHLNFEDAGDDRFGYKVTFEKGKAPTLRRESLNVAQFFTFDPDAEDVGRVLEAQVPDDSYIRIRVHGDSAALSRAAADIADVNRDLQQTMRLVLWEQVIEVKRKQRLKVDAEQVRQGNVLWEQVLDDCITADAASEALNRSRLVQMGLDALRD